MELPRSPDHPARRSRSVRGMKNQDIYQRDPSKITLLNNGVATMTDALTDDERRTLRFELEHFVCEGEYQRGLVRILDSYVSNQGQPEQRRPGSAASSAAVSLTWRRCCVSCGPTTPFRKTARVRGAWPDCRPMCRTCSRRSPHWVSAPPGFMRQRARWAPAPAIVSGFRCSVSCSSPRIFPRAIRRRVSAFGSRRTASTSRFVPQSRPRSVISGAS